MKRDLNDIAKIEKAIEDKYGEEAVQNPKKFWDKEKEAKYLKEIKEFYSKREKKQKIIQNEGFIIKDNSLGNFCPRTCPHCKEYSTRASDDVYMTKYGCCFNCYIQFIEGREAKWKSGWRPKK